MGARSVPATRLLLLPRARFECLAAEVPALASIVDDLGELRALEPEVLSGLRRSALSKHFSPRALGEMCEVADIAALRPGDVALRQGDDAPGFSLQLNQPRKPPPPQPGVQKALAFEVAQALDGKHWSGLRAGDDGERVVSVSIPIQHVQAVLGVLTLEASDVDEIIARERVALIPFLSLIHI